MFEKWRESCEVTSEWAKENIAAIFKKWRKEVLWNHRPVSLTYVPGEIMEQTILEDTLWHIKDKELFWGSLHGFTKGKLCLTNLVTFYSGVMATVNMERPTNIFCLEFCNAFNTAMFFSWLEAMPLIP